MSNQESDKSVEINPEVAADGETSISNSTFHTEPSSSIAESSIPKHSSSSTSQAKPQSLAQPTCQNCNKSDSELTKCSKCKSVYYCSKECVKANFKAHKKVCPSLAQEWAKGADIKMATRSSGAGRVREKGIGKWEYDT